MVRQWPQVSRAGSKATEAFFTSLTNTASSTLSSSPSSIATNRRSFGSDTTSPTRWPRGHGFFRLDMATLPFSGYWPGIELTFGRGGGSTFRPLPPVLQGTSKTRFMLDAPEVILYSEVSVLKKMFDSPAEVAQP